MGFITDNLFNIFEAHKDKLEVPPLVDTVEYIIHSRLPGQSWGPYKGVQSTIPCSALAIESLCRYGDKEDEYIAVATSLRHNYNKNIDGLSAEELAYLLQVAKLENGKDDEYIKQLTQKVESLVTQYISNTMPIGISCLCTSMLAILGANEVTEQTDFITTCLNTLLKAQLPDGSWPSVVGVTNSFVATSLAIRVLLHFDQPSSNQALQHGIGFLKPYLVSDRFLNTGLTADTFTYALVLRALAEVHERDSYQVPYDVIQAGVDYFLRIRNDDGGWGAGVNELSNVESSSLVLLALIAARQHLYVLEPLATALVCELKNDNADLQTVVSKIDDNVSERVKIEYKSIAEDQALLRDEVTSLKEQLSTANDKVKKLTLEVSTLTEKGRHTDRQLVRLRSTLSSKNTYSTIISILSRIAYMSAGLLVAIVAISVLPCALSVYAKMAMGICTVIFIFIVEAYSTKLLARRNTDIVKFIDLMSTSEISDSSQGILSLLRSSFVSFMMSLPSETQEELVYRFYADVIDMPPTLVQRYAEDLVLGLGMPRESLAYLSQLLSAITQLPAYDRRILFDQLRRMILK